MPWVPRSTHEESTALLQAQIVRLEAQVVRLEAERVVLYDRLGLMGLGGPLFTVPAVALETEPEEVPDLVDPDELRKKLLAMRIPSRRRAEVKRLVEEEYRKRGTVPPVAWVAVAEAEARVTAAMDAAEAEGRKQA